MTSPYQNPSTDQSKASLGRLGCHSGSHWHLPHISQPKDQNLLDSSSQAHNIHDPSKNQWNSRLILTLNLNLTPFIHSALAGHSNSNSGGPSFYILACLPAFTVFDTKRSIIICKLISNIHKHQVQGKSKKVKTACDNFENVSELVSEQLTSQDVCFDKCNEMSFPGNPTQKWKSQQHYSS